MKTVYSEKYAEFLRLIIQARKNSGMTQQALAQAIGRPQSFVSKYENRERRLDVVEFLMLANALHFEPAIFIEMLVQKFEKPIG